MRKLKPNKLRHLSKVSQAELKLALEIMPCLYSESKLGIHYHLKVEDCFPNSYLFIMF